MTSSVILMFSESCYFIVISISDSVLTYFQNYHNVMTSLERQESKYYLIVKTQSVHIPFSIVKRLINANYGADAGKILHSIHWTISGLYNCSQSIEYINSEILQSATLSHTLQHSLALQSIVECCQKDKLLLCWLSVWIYRWWIKIG